MSNFLAPFKKFLQNKNTVTILCIVIGVLTLVIGYNYRVNKAIELVTVPFARVEIPKKTQITKDMIGHIKIPKSLLSTAKNVIQSDKELINFYSSYSTSIPKNSLFFKEVVLKEEQMPDYAFMNMEDGTTVYSLKVNNKSTYSNRLRPNTYIDLYVYIKNGENNVLAPLISSIRIKAVKDSAGKSLLENTISGGTPTALLFEVNNDLFYILKLAEYVQGVEVIPIPRNAHYTQEQGTIQVNSEEVIRIIKEQAITINE